MEGFLDFPDSSNIIALEHKIEIESSEIFLFADENKLFRSIYSDPDTLLVQRDIDKMYSWPTNSLLCFHPDKCYSINFVTNLNNAVITTTK